MRRPFKGGGVFTEWEQVSITLSDNQNVSSNIAYIRRCGDTLELRHRITWSGASTGAVFTVTLPYQLNIATNKIPSTSALTTAFGHGIWFDSGSGVRDAHAMISSVTAIEFYVGGGTGNQASFTGGNGTGDWLSYYANIPIAQWVASHR